MLESLSIPLSHLRGNCSVQVEELNGQDAFSKKLSEMGINKGTYITIVKNDCAAIVIKICETKLVLSKGMAQRIMVKVKEDGNE